MATDDILIDYTGSMMLLNNSFENDRTSSSEFKVRSGNPVDLTGTTAAQITSIGNWYKYSIGNAPIYNGSDVRISGDGAGTIGSDLRLLTLNDYGGDAGAYESLRPKLGGIGINLARIASDNISTNVTQDYLGEPKRGSHKITIPKEAWITAGLTQTLNIGNMLKGTRVVSVISDTTVAFAGLAGTIVLEIGDQDDSDGHILSHDVKTAVVVKGLADADLGTLLVRANAVQGGFIGSWTATKTLKVTLTSSSGNLGDGATTSLSAGNIEIYIVTERALD